jgi:hypothetical protein
MSGAPESIKGGEEFLEGAIEFPAQMLGFETPFACTHFATHQH